ncbi:MAG: filamentous hemagglutinin N-terminal domain-containing protein [Gallionellaceae bacterium]|nr:filamentous hemagglutinin N-terminal domain-containing protein [Gallionellaceae bacterium]
MKKMSVNKHQFQIRPICAALLLVFAAQAARANPVGPTVVNGQASFATTGNTLTVTNTPGAIINWQGFSIGANEITRFAQQSAASSVLNRVTSSSPSNILGSLQSNGRVFLVNPNGIVFGQGATVDVAGLVATSLNLSNADFLAGRYRFSSPLPLAGEGSGERVTNAGNLTAQNGGQIYLIAPNVENNGVITAPNGEILLAAGHSVELVDTANPNLRVNIIAPAGGVTNVGQLVASSGSLGLFGAVVRNSGTVSADSAAMQGGKIVFKASQRVEAGGTISAQGVGGGEIKVLADMQGGAVNVTGTLDASAPNSGNGGFIETSAAHVQVADIAHITTAATNGKAGMWLLDPYDFTIAATGGDITGATLSTALGAGAVTIQTAIGSVSCIGATCGTGTVAGNGDIFVNDTVSWSANKLTLSAYRNIQINQAMNGSGTASLALEYGQSAVAAGNTSTYNVKAPVNLASTSGFSTKLGSDGLVTNYTVITSLGVVGSTTGTDLQGMSGNLAGRYALGSNIDATATSTWNAGAGFAPVGTYIGFGCVGCFTGAFDGLGHTITGLTINRPAQSYVGLFGYTNNATIRNVGLVGGSVNGNVYVGGLAGYNMGAISNSYSTATVNMVGAGAGEGGGLAGDNTGTITNSYSTGAVTGVASTVGGLVGSNFGTITNSYNTGNVSGSNTVGGLVGYNWTTTTITNSYNTGAVSGSADTVGGLVAYNRSGPITNSYNTGAVSGTFNVAGLVGYLTAGAITNSYNTGSVTGSSNYVGGLTGYNGDIITNSYSTGAVTGATSSNYVGGLVAYNGWTITNSYSSGAVVSGGTGVGGLAGFNNGTITNSYWDTQTSVQATSAGGTSLTTAQMKTMASFAGWSIANTGGSNAVWRIYEGHTYPLLRSFLTPLTLTSAPDVAVTYNGAAQSGGAFTLIPNVLGAAATGTNAGFYNGYYSIQQGYNITGGNLTIAPLPVTLAGNKVYDGTPTFSTTQLGISNIVSGDVVSLSAGTANTADKNVGINKPFVSLSGLALTGASAGNYTVTGVSGAGTITQLPSVAYTGASGNWSNAANWAGGAIPDYANVAAVTIPSGVTVTYDSGVSGTTMLNTLASSGSLAMAAGALTLNAASSTSALSMAGGTLTSPAGLTVNDYTQTGGALNIGGTTLLKSSGSMAVNGAIASNMGGTLTLQAVNNISLGTGGSITGTVAPLNVVLNSDSTGVGGGNIQITSSIATNGGNVIFAGGINGAGVAAGASTASSAVATGVYLSGASVNAGGGNITMRGTGMAGTSFGADGIYITGNSVVQTSGAGAITLSGTGGAGGVGSSFNSGVRFGTGAQLSSVNGAIMLTGQGGAGNNGSNYGVYAHNGATITSTGSGTITLNGTGASTGTGNAGVRVSASAGATKIMTAGGALTVTATGGVTSDGLDIVAGALVQSGTGLLTLSGTGGTGAASYYGTWISGAGTQVTSGGGMNISGISNSTGANNHGVSIDTGAKATTTAGAMTITGTSGIGGTSDAVLLSGTPVGGVVNAAAGLNITGWGDVVLNAGSVINAGTGNVSIWGTKNILFAANSSLAPLAGAVVNVSLSSGSNGGNYGGIYLDTGSSINSNGGNISMGGGYRGYALGNGTVTGGITFNSGIYVLGNITAGAGNVTMRGEGANNNFADGITFAGGTLSSNGIVNIDGIAHGYSTGTVNPNLFAAGVDFLNAGTRLTTQTGMVTVTGLNTAPNADPAYYRADGIMVETGAIVETTGAGTLTFNGTANSYNTSWGLGVLGGIIQSTAASGGAITLNGTNASIYADGGVVILGGSVLSNGGEIRMTGAGLGGSVGIVSGSTIGGASSGDILIKANNTGTIDLNSASSINAGNSTLTIQAAGGTVTDHNLSTNSITAGALRLLGTGVFNLGSVNNNVGALAANVTGSITYADTNGFSIGSVTSFDGAAVTTTAGILTNNGNFTAVANNSVTPGNIILNANSAINTGTGALSLTATGGSLNINGNISAGSFTLNGGTWNQVSATLPGFTVNDFRLMSGTFIRALGGNGSIATPYLLTDIYGVQGMGSALTSSFALANNINASGTVNWNAGAGFAPVGNAITQFTGTFDGQNHTISSLTINRPATSDVGLFGVVGPVGSVSNVGLVASTVTGSNTVGGLAGYNYGAITNTYTSGSTVSGSGNVGGLAGQNSGAITNTYASGGIVNGASTVGGLAGANWNRINTSYSTNAVAAGGGGLIGWDEMGYINNSYWDIQTSGRATSSGKEKGLTTAQMMTMANFNSATPANGNVNPGWSIANTGGAGKVWRIYEGQAYPLLASFLTPLTVTASAATKTYDGLAYSGGSGVAYSAASPVLSGTLAYGGTSQGAINTGGYAIIASGFYSNQQGYDISYVNGTLTINPAPLTVTANALSKTVGSADPPLTYITAGLKANDTASTTLSGALARLAGEAAGLYPINQSTLALLGANYTMSYVPADFGIVAAAPVTTVLAPAVNTLVNSIIVALPADPKKGALAVPVADAISLLTTQIAAVPLPVCK